MLNLQEVLSLFKISSAQMEELNENKREGDKKRVEVKKRAYLKCSRMLSSVGLEIVEMTFSHLMMMSCDDYDFQFSSVHYD